MTDSKKTNDLDRYGVWVKKPPRTVDSENTAQAPDDDFSLTDITSDLPDFSSLDSLDSTSPADTPLSFQEGDTTLSTEELSGIAGSAELIKEQPADTEMINDNKEDTMTQDKGTSSTEEIPLDEFITGGFSEDSASSSSDSASSPNNNKPDTPAEPKAEQPAAASLSEEAVSVDDFLNSDNSFQPSPAETPSAEPVSDDTPLDINLSFDDAPAATPADNSTFNEPALSDFPSESAAPVQDSASPAMTGTEDVDLSTFGLDETVSAGTDHPSAAEPSSSSDGTTSVDLSEFGIEDSASQNTAAQPEPAAPASPSSSSKVDYDMHVSADDDTSTDVKNNTAPADTESGKKPEPSFTAPEDSDFDIDAIMSDVKDEHGKTVCIGKAEDTLVKEVNAVPAEKIQEPVVSEEIEDLSAGNTEQPHEIPDTFDEETASLLGDHDTSTETVAETRQPSVSGPVQNESSNEILKQIVGELDSLKSEIAGLKTEFADLKKREESAVAAPAEPQPGEDNGFFSNVGEDDTIALSGDELDNILNNADFSEPSSAESEHAERKEEAAVPSEPEAAAPEADEAESIEPEPVLSEETAEPEPAAELPQESVSDETADAEEQQLFGDVDNSIDIPDQDFEESSDLNMDFSNDNLEEPSLDDINLSLNPPSDDSSISKELPDEISVPKVDDILVDSSSVDLMDAGDEATADTQSAEAEQTEPEQITPEQEAVSEQTESFQAPEAPKEIEKLYQPDPSISETLTDEKIDYLAADKEAEQPKEAAPEASSTSIPGDLKQEIKSVLSYMDQLLENLPEDKITEFAQSEQFDTYKKLFKELGLS